MGLIYNPTDSQGLVSALNANIRTADEMIESLNRASKYLIDALGNKTLSGAAFTAGKGMFSQLVIPTISKASQALDKLKSEAKQYEDFSANAGDDLLDEDKLNEQLQTLQMQQVALDSQISFFKQLAASHPDDSALNTSYADSSKQLYSFMSTTASDIQNVQDKLKKLHEFNTSVSPLFKDSTDEFKTIMSIVIAIGAVEFDKAGKFVLSINDNKDFQRLKDIANSGGIFKDIGESLLESDTIYGTMEDASKYFVQKGDQYILKGEGRNFSRLTRKGNAYKSLGEDTLEMAQEFNAGKISTGLKVAGGIGSILSVGLDYDEQMSKYNDPGRAFKNTVVHQTINWGGAEVGMAIGTALFPGAGTIAGAVIGAGIGYIGNGLYDWVESGKAGKDIEKIGKNISDGVDNLKDEASKVFSGFGKSLGSVFG